MEPIGVESSPGFRATPPEDSAWERRFGGVARLYGREALHDFKKARVFVVGLGGVGSWTVEALARSGVGSLVLVDLDDVCITNTNRQIHTLQDTLGEMKTTALAERVRAISPECGVEERPVYLSATNVASHIAPPVSMVVDAIDRAPVKAALLAFCLRNGFPVVTVGGAGGKLDPTRVKCTDLVSTFGDELLRQTRKILRREWGFGSQEKRPFGIDAVFSDERRRFPWSDGCIHAEPEPGEHPAALDCASGFGAACHLTGTFGFVAAAAVLRRLSGNGTGGSHFPTSA